eukprot:5614960-Prymnesium_polylepis.1
MRSAGLRVASRSIFRLWIYMGTRPCSLQYAPQSRRFPAHHVHAVFNATSAPVDVHGCVHEHAAVLFDARSHLRDGHVVHLHDSLVAECVVGDVIRRVKDGVATRGEQAAYGADAAGRRHGTRGARVSEPITSRRFVEAARDGARAWRSPLHLPRRVVLQREQRVSKAEAGAGRGRRGAALCA